MKALLTVPISLVFFCCMPSHRHTGGPFTADRVSRTAVITLHGAPTRVFPLFGPLEEKKWAEGWNPEFLSPRPDAVEEGIVFRTPGHGHDESEYHWIVSTYQPDEFRIGYVVSTPNRFWMISIRCTAISDTETAATVSYSGTGLNDLGNEFNKHYIEGVFKHDLKDWEDAINSYLRTGTAIRHR